MKQLKDDNDLEKPIDEEFAEQLYDEPEAPKDQCNAERAVSITGADLLKSEKPELKDDNDLEKPIDEEFAEQLYDEPEDAKDQCNIEREVSITGAELHPCDQAEAS